MDVRINDTSWELYEDGRLICTQPISEKGLSALLHFGMEEGYRDGHRDGFSDASRGEEWTNKMSAVGVSN